MYRLERIFFNLGYLIKRLSRMQKSDGKKRYAAQHECVSGLSVQRAVTIPVFFHCCLSGAPFSQFVIVTSEDRPNVLQP